MPKITNENSIEEKLKYLGLDIEKIPEFFKEYKNLEYRPLKVYAENTYKVYKYVPISKIQILLTPMNRLNTIKEKYGKASSVYSYLQPDKEEDIIKHTTFLRMLKEVQIQEIEAVGEEQKKLNKQVPFKVKFEENYLWQIYYSDTTDTYFMLVPTEDLEYATFFYLLKKQIEYNKTKKDEMIFAPICYQNYSGEFLKSSEISDMEKYLWFFTKNWSNIYEVYDKDGNLNIVVVGDAVVYDDIISSYRNKLQTKEEATKFYKLLKALFILATELPHYYKFEVKLNRFGAIEFEYNKKKINYDNMLELLNKQYLLAKENIQKLEKQELDLQKELNNLKQTALKRDQEYLIKEKQIATYLECRKTFFGRVKYFLKSKKMKRHQNEKVEKEENNKVEEHIQIQKIQFIEKEYYTIEDVVKIYKDLDSIIARVKNLDLDINALKNRIKSMETKIKNANLYIEEIDTHEKNIFEFWRFTNKDESLLLNQGEVQEEAYKKKIEKVYNYKEDFEEIGNLIDKNQRKNFNKEELDDIYILTTEIFNIINQLDNKKVLEQSLEKLKQEAENERILFSTDKLDIFGNIAEDHTKIKMLGSKKHRENAKDKLKILDIHKDTTIEEYKNRLSTILENVNKCINSAKSSLAIPIYIASSEKLNLDGLQTFWINPEEAINEIEADKEVYIYKINLKEQSNVIYFSNSVYYDNYNKTLPLGMNMGTRGIIDIGKCNLNQVYKDDFRISELIDEFKINSKKICVQEYEILEEKNDK